MDAIKKSTGKGFNKQKEEEFDKDIISKIPNLELAQLFFLVKDADVDPSTKAEKWTELLSHIKANEMGTYYEYVCQEAKVPIDKGLRKELLEQNDKRIAEIESEIEDAEKNLGESEVRQAWLRKSEYLCQIGNKEAAVTAFRQTYEKTVGIGYRIDLVFNLIRLGLFFMDHQLITSNISKAKELMEQGGDWDRKNRLRTYEGLYKMAIRDMKGSADLFLESVPTFGSYELMTYEQLVFYTIVVAIHSFERPDLRSKVIQCSEIQQQLNAENADVPGLSTAKEFLTSFYNCHYDEFFQSLAKLERENLKLDRYLEPHYHYYTRAMRLKAYQQFLTPYKTVRMDAMARNFGISKKYLDKELHANIAANQLNCRIDAVNGIIEMNHVDNKNSLYKALIRDGDILSNRVQKLARIVH